jgi:hypothetical protein
VPLRHRPWRQCPRRRRNRAYSYISPFFPPFLILLPDLPWTPHPRPRRLPGSAPAPRPLAPHSRRRRRSRVADIARRPHTHFYPSAMMLGDPAQLRAVPAIPSTKFCPAYRRRSPVPSNAFTLSPKAAPFRIQLNRPRAGSAYCHVIDGDFALRSSHAITPSPSAMLKDMRTHRTASCAAAAVPLSRPLQCDARPTHLAAASARSQC